MQAVIKTTLRDRQIVLLSASVGSETLQRAKQIMKENMLRLEGETKSGLGLVPENIAHHYILTTHREKFVMLRKVLAGEKPQKAMIFLNNPENIEVTVDKLNYHGIKADGIYGQAGKTSRKTALENFRNGKISVLVASDIGARGLDIPDVTHVIHMDIPEDPTQYLHRAGRCGRNGKSGYSISIVTPYERKWIHKYEKVWGIRFTQKDMIQGKLTDSTKQKKICRKNQKNNQIYQTKIILHRKNKKQKKHIKKRNKTLQKEYLIFSYASKYCKILTAFVLFAIKT